MQVNFCRYGERIGFLILALLLGAGAGMPVFAGVENNPGYDRPGLGFTPAVLQAGDFTLEQGLPDWSHDQGISFYDNDALLRLGLGHALELQLGSGWGSLEGAGMRHDGRIDTSLAVKFASAVDGAFSWGVLGGAEFADGAPAFRTDQPQYLLGISFNWQTEADQGFGFYMEDLHGEVDSQLLAGNSSWTLTPEFGAYVKLGVQHLGQQGYGSMAGAGLTWQLTPRVQLDFSARHRLSGTADAWQGGVGFAVYFGD